MKPNEYIKTIVIYGKMINVGIDDYGQQYFLEYVDDNGQLQEVGCGAYNSDIEDVAKTIIDSRRYMIEEYGEEEVLKMEEAKRKRMERYND